MKQKDKIAQLLSNPESSSCTDETVEGFKGSEEMTALLPRSARSSTLGGLEPREDAASVADSSGIAESEDSEELGDARERLAEEEEERLREYRDQSETRVMLSLADYMTLLDVLRHIKSDYPTLCDEHTRKIECFLDLYRTENRSTLDGSDLNAVGELMDSLREDLHGFDEDFIPEPGSFDDDLYRMERLSIWRRS